MTVPREIRLEIWRLLLSATNRYITKHRKWSEPSSFFDFDLSILVVCKKIYREAASVLYDENMWIFLSEENITANPRNLALYTGEPRQGMGIYESAGLLIPSQHRLEDLIKSPILSIDLSYRGPQPDSAFRKYKYAVAFERQIMPHICAMIWKRARKEDLNMTIKFQSQAVKMTCGAYGHIISSLRTIRGLGNVKIWGPITEADRQQLEKDLESSYGSYGECAELLTEYLAQGLRFASDKQLTESVFVLYTAIDHYRHQIRPRMPTLYGFYNQNGTKLSTESLIARNEFYDVLIDLYTSAAFVLTIRAEIVKDLEFADLEFAEIYASAALMYPEIRDGARARAHWVRALCLSATGEKQLSAMDCFYAFSLASDNPVLKARLLELESLIGCKADTIAPLETISVEREDGTIFTWTGDPRLISDDEPFSDDSGRGWGRKRMKYIERYQLRQVNKSHESIWSPVISELIGLTPGRSW